MKKVKTPRLYLSHSSHEKERGKEIQKKLEDMGYEVHNPFDKETPGEITWTGDMSKELADWVVETDHREIRKSDGMVCIYPEDGRTIGEPCEMAFAYFLRMPIFSYVPDCIKGHPWPIGQSTVVFRDLDLLLLNLQVEMDMVEEALKNSQAG